MVDPSEMEIAAMQSSLSPLGEYVGSIGMERPLVAYTRNEVLALIEVVVTAFQEHMLIEHERLATQERAFLEERLACQGKTESKGVPR